MRFGIICETCRQNRFQRMASGCSAGSKRSLRSRILGSFNLSLLKGKMKAIADRFGFQALF
ncbi:hypothetical protein ACFOEZ_08425 [Tianweitania populi]|uniref:hypothetical protein n=1 Tax=Tianweitania populi TaxID=1607949 RepID=UPI001FCEC719|nr:hypothetical protein [Tianweitania populi]